MQKDSSFRRNLIIIGCCWAAIFMFVLGGIVGATLSPSSTRITTPAPANTTTSPLCPRQWVSGVGWVAIVHTRCNIYSAAMGVDSQMPLPKACTGVDIVTGEAIPSGCDGILGSQRFATTNTGSTGSAAITPPPAPASADGHVDCPGHEIYTVQGCVGELPNGTVIIPPRIYPPPKGKCVRTSTTWVCTPTRPVTG